MKTILRKARAVLLPLLLVGGCTTAQAATLNIFACEPEWGALAQELGGDNVDVFTATTALQDPHHIQARPSLIAKMRKADLLVCTGAGLESGWLPLLLRQSGNSKVQPGKPGYFEATRYVETLDKPQSVDRSHGDVHPGGNPHIQTSPHNISKVAAALLPLLQQLDADNSAAYQQRADDFSKRWQAAMQRWETKAAPLRGVAVVVHHRSWSYLQQWLELNEVATLEPKPGVPASAGHLAEVLQQLDAQPARMIIRAAYQDGRADEWLADKTGLPAIALPFTVGGSEQAQDLFSLYDDTISRLLDGLAP
jgi:zinc/manganese transport system substrate-binding protein